MRHGVLPPGYASGVHFHEQQEETYFVHRGQIEFRFGDGTAHVLEAGGMAPVDAATHRGLRNVGQDDAIVLVAGGKDGYVGRDGQAVGENAGHDPPGAWPRSSRRLPRAPGSTLGPMPVRLSSAARTAAMFMALCAAALAAPPAGMAARLVGGSTQKAIARAFSAQRSHRGQVVVSIRTSTVSRSWAVVRSVTPRAVGQTRSGATPAVHSTYYHLAGRRVQPASPPRAVRTDLARSFSVEVVYAGSGSESIFYDQSSRSVCPGSGGFTDSATDTVNPMSWTVRYVVDLDDLRSTVRGPAGVTLVPNVDFDAAGSRINASENVVRSVQDLGCNQNKTTFSCTTTFTAGGADPGGQLSFQGGSGLEVGLPMATRPRGACDPDNFTLGPSLWDNGGATALVGQLRLIGGTLPANPYAPVMVSWPGGSAAQAQGFAVSPCQGEPAAVCHDTFTWQGTVALQAVPGG